jgi:hypothetical protein
LVRRFPPPPPPALTFLRVALDLPFIEARRGSRRTTGGIAMR